MTIELRQRVGDAYVVAVLDENGACKVEVTDAMSNPISGPERDRALEAILQGINTMRRHVWKVELGR